MGPVYLVCSVLLLSSGALSADKATLGESCTPATDTCTINGAVCDKTTKTCVCNDGYVQSGSECAREHFMPCGRGMCANMDKTVCENRKCQCDSTKGRVASGASCGCKTGYTEIGGVCKALIGTTCSATSDCESGLVCETTCKCDPAKNYPAGTSGARASTCACPNNYQYHPTENKCMKVRGQPCTTTAECYTTDGLICTGSTCACNTAGKFVDGTTNTHSSACACPDNYQYHPTEKKCMKVRGQSCTPTTDDCYTTPGLACTGGTCTCNTAANYAAGTTNTHSAACGCGAGYALVGDVCKARVGTACTLTSDCDPGLVCDTTCKCDAAKNYVAPGTANSRASECACTPSTYVKVDSGDCKAVVGTACSAASPCDDGLVCDTTCKCDAAKHFVAPGATGARGFQCECTSSTYVKLGSVCRAVIGTTCSATSICEDGLVCDTTCKCDPAKLYPAGTSGNRASTCACPANSMFHTTANKCMKERGQSCTTTADCYTTPGLVCTSGTCTCNTAGNFENGANTHSTACACKTGYVDVGGVCKAKVSRACTTTTDCDPGLVCDGSVCKCDATKFFVAPGTADSRASACACAGGYIPEDYMCKVNLGQACTRGSNSAPCVYKAVCSKETDKCACDAARGYKLNGAGTACECIATYVPDDDECLAPLESSCSSSCVSGATCFAGNATYVFPICLCNGAVNADGTCSSAVGLFASLSSLMTALFVAWRLM